MTREKLVVRQWQMLDAMSRGPKTYADLAHQFQCSTKTIRRDLAAMIHVGLPVIRNGPYYTSTFRENSMAIKVPMYCMTCKRELQNPQSVGVHRRRNHHITEPNWAETPETKPLGSTFTRADLFSVIKGDIHLRGCEFNGGFLVLNGDTLQFHPSLAHAIANAEAAMAETNEMRKQPVAFANEHA